MFVCPEYNWGSKANRDYNASLNILKIGEGRPVAPVERVSSVKQEAPSKKARGSSREVLTDKNKKKPLNVIKEIIKAKKLPYKCDKNTLIKFNLMS